ncbi:MAG TPA: DUF4350 domain-containing protein [Gemmatimonadaceae bacterium]|jgi:hypothetical protein
MTIPAPNDDAGRRRRRWRAAGLAGVLVLIVLAALLTPDMIGGRSGDQRLTTFSTDAPGARLFYELAHRLGWKAERWIGGPAVPADQRTIVAILDPVQPIGAVEAHTVLEQVRAGSALMYVMSSISPLNDSLHVKRRSFGGAYQPTAAGTADAPRQPSASDTARARRFPSATRDTSTIDDDEAEASAVECAHLPPNGGLPMWSDQVVRLWRFQFTQPRPAGTVIFARSAPEAESRDTAAGRSAPAAAGFPLGAGRVVVISDPDLLRNDVLRVCRSGLDVVSIRMLEYLTAGEPHRDRLVFDEYHQGFGTHPGTVRAIAVYLSRVPSGHLLLQAMAAGLILLFALGPRTLPPRDVERVERRSPLEHVGALAQAYARVAATRTATMRLLRGVRRRVEPSGRDGGGTAEERDVRFLDAAARAPARAADVALVRRALETPVGEREFEEVGAALARLEESLLAERR